MGVNLVLAAAEPVSGGGYVSIYKIVLALLILLVWARLLAWADEDAPAAHMPRIPFNIGNLLGLIVAYAIFFLIPGAFSFWIGLPILLAGIGIEVAVYLNYRKKLVGLYDLRKQWNAYLASFGGKKKEVTGPGEVVLMSKAGPVLPPDPTSPDKLAYDATQLALTDPLKKGADQVDIDGRAEGGANLKYIVDGVSYTGQTTDRVTGGAAISYIKGLAGMDVEERRKPQTGSMKLGVGSRKREVKIQTAGNTAGEYMRMMLDPKQRHNYSLDTLGFTDEQLAKIRESIKSNSGVVLLSTPKGMGLTSLLYGVLRGHDAFLQHLQTVERDPEEDLEGVTQNKLAANAPASEESKTVDWVISQEPDAILLNKIEDPRSAVELINFSKNGRRVYIGMRASSTFEALNQWRKLVADDNLAIESLAMAINGRVIRKLCNNCKVPYAPDPGTLRKLGMNPDRITQLYQARTEPIRDPKGNPIPCEFCGDLHYQGRTGVFEIMTVDDDIRAAVITGKPVEPVFRKQRAKFLQEEALALVEQGETSVQEVKRVLKGETGAAGSDESSGGGGAAKPPAPVAGSPAVPKASRRAAPGAVRNG
jgi:type II secretory ATPase GspE/PulE/Tfp pilus assembly ATPase PilB-like protein